MTIDAIGFLPPASGVPLPDLANAADHTNGSAAAKTPGASDFASWLRTSLAETNRQLLDADRQVVRLAAGDTDNLHQVMLSLDKAKVSFQLMVQVRNRLLESYQDILRMQI